MLRLRAVLLSAACAVLAMACRRPAPLDVVLVVVDTLRADHLAPYGYPRDTAPFLSQLAREGATFDAVSPTSWTKPAVASLLTGLHPLRHGANGRLQTLPPAALTLAERFHARGYRTLALSANGWVTPQFGFDRGFDRFLVCDACSAPQVTARLPGLLSAQDSRPLFLYVQLIDPHAPYEPTLTWDGRPLSPAERDRLAVKVEDLAATEFAARPSSFLARVRDAYDGEIRQADAHVRGLADLLASRGLMRHTLFVVTSDHGEELQDHGRMSHGQTVYNEVVHVPLILRGPGIPSGARLGRASLLDVVPTLVDLAGLAKEDTPQVDGSSLVARLLHHAPVDRRPYLLHLDFIDGTALALQSDRYTLVLGRDPYRKQLFDDAADPRQQHDLLSRPTSASLVRELGTTMASLFNRYSRSASTPRLASIDAESAAKFASLGYAGGTAPGPLHRMPRRMAVPEPRPDGLLGWESAEPCLTLGSPRADEQLLAGWWGREPQGRWTQGFASAALGRPAGSGPWELRLAGMNYRPDAARLVVRLDDDEVLSASVPPGPFALATQRRELPPRSPFVLRLDVSPTYHPADDARTLGLFVSHACVVPAVTGTALAVER